MIPAVFCRRPKVVASVVQDETPGQLLYLLLCGMQPLSLARKCIRHVAC